VRYFSDKLSALAGKPVIVENRGGAAGMIGTETAAKSKPDGYTILITPGSATLAAAKHIFKKLPFDPLKDFAPVTTLAKVPFVIAVDPKSSMKSIGELTAHLKAKGDKASFGVTSNTALISAELYKKVAGLHAAKVQYRENQTLMNDLIAGSIDFVASDAAFASSQAQGGKIRPLAVTSGERLPSLPDVATMQQAGLKDYVELVSWWGVFVPAGTPQPVIEKLEGWFKQIAASEDTKKFLTGLGSAPFPGSARGLGELLAKDIERWGDYVKLAGIQPQ
jgi:tripartite-type tricarboxylate transporter receptor subunit TctC